MNAHLHHILFGRLTPTVQGRAKKARVNRLENDVFLESDDQDDTPSAFSQTLSRFKKSPKRKGRHKWLLPSHIWPHFLLFELQRVLPDAQMMTATTTMKTISLSLTTAKMMSRHALLVLLSALLVNPF